MNKLLAYISDGESGQAIITILDALGVHYEIQSSNIIESEVIKDSFVLEYIPVEE